jgi:hypothetical protein
VIAANIDREADHSVCVRKARWSSGLSVGVSSLLSACTST